MKEWELASVAWKWLDKPEIKCLSRIDFKDKTDKSLTKELWKLLDEADVVIAHNGDSFDIKMSQGKFIEHGLQPTSPFKSIDTKKIAKAEFRFNSNSLNDLGQTLGLGKKVDTGGFQLWLDCINGKQSAWNKMKQYNKQDVALLEKVYLRMRPWSKQNHGIHLLGEKWLACPRCGNEYYYLQGRRLMAGGWKSRLQCKGCGSWYSVPEKKRLNQEALDRLK